MSYSIELASQGLFYPLDAKNTHLIREILLLERISNPDTSLMRQQGITPKAVPLRPSPVRRAYEISDNSILKCDLYLLFVILPEFSAEDAFQQFSGGITG